MGWRIGVGLALFYFVMPKNDCKATEDSLSTATELWREESDGNLYFRHGSFSVEREFHIQHLQIAQKTLPRIFIPVKHKTALWKKCCGSLATSRVV